MWRLGKPIIAAVNGWAMGGGFWYQLAADITIASDQAVFAQPEVRHISNTSFLLAALCGWKAANRWGLTGDHFDAQEALRIGMVNEVVPHDQLMEHARALAKRIALVPEPSVRLNKAIAMHGHAGGRRCSGLLLEGTLGALAHSSHNEFREKLFDVQRSEGVKAYLETRRPVPARADGPALQESQAPNGAEPVRVASRTSIPRRCRRHRRVKCGSSAWPTHPSSCGPPVGRQVHRSIRLHDEPKGVLKVNPPT